MSVPLYTVLITCKYTGDSTILFETLDKALASEIREVIEEHGKKYPSFELEVTDELLIIINKLDDLASAYVGSPIHLSELANTEMYSVIIRETTLKSRSSIGNKP